jgi:hypothetical protein
VDFVLETGDDGDDNILKPWYVFRLMNSNCEYQLYPFPRSIILSYFPDVYLELHISTLHFPISFYIKKPVLLLVIYVITKASGNMMSHKFRSSEKPLNNLAVFIAVIRPATVHLITLLSRIEIRGFHENILLRPFGDERTRGGPNSSGPALS